MRSVWLFLYVCVLVKRGLLLGVWIRAPDCWKLPSGAVIGQYLGGNLESGLEP